MDMVGDVGGVENGDGDADLSKERVPEVEDVQCSVPWVDTLPAESEADGIQTGPWGLGEYY